MRHMANGLEQMPVCDNGECLNSYSIKTNVNILVDQNIMRPIFVFVVDGGDMEQG